MKYDQELVLLTTLLMLSLNSTNGTDMENILEKAFGNPYADCLEVKECTNCKGTALLGSFRTHDGTCNRLKLPLSGASMTVHQRFIEGEYATGTTSFPRGFLDVTPKLPSAHKIAQNVFDAVERTDGNKFPTSILFMIFGQFIDHDVTMVSHDKTEEKCPSAVSCSRHAWRRDYKYPCFPIMNREGTGCTKLTRTKAACQKKNGNVNKKREQVNTITSFVDGSAIYGSSLERSLELRRLDGSGGLRMTRRKNLMPMDQTLDERCNLRGMHGCFASGDTRSSEHIGLAAFHTLWAREHNRVANHLRKLNWFWSGSMVYYTARRIVIGEIQHILYNEWLPKVYDVNPVYHGYDPVGSDPAIANVFAHGAFRFGHTLVPNALPQLDPDFNYVRPNVGLRDAFFNMKPILDHGIESTILGMVGNESETVDGRFASAIVRHLFLQPNDPTLEDLSAINIHRGRDHGVPPYYKWREWCTGERIGGNWESLRGVMPNAAIAKLKKVYGSTHDIDLFVGGILEHHDGLKIVGKTFGCLIGEQFERLRYGDRYHYQNRNVFNEEQFESISSVTMRQILCDNLVNMTSLHDDVFLAYNKYRTRHVCEPSGPKSRFSMNLNLWKEDPPVRV